MLSLISALIDVAVWCLLPFVIRLFVKAGWGYEIPLGNREYLFAMAIIIHLYLVFKPRRRR